MPLSVKRKDNWLAWLEKQKPDEWSEEDEIALGDALWCCKQAASIAKNENDMGNVWYAETWLKNLKERVQSQLQWKPSEKHKFNIGDIISNGQAVYRVDDITKNCIGQDCYSLVNVESEENGTRYISLTDSEGKHSNVGEIAFLCELVDKSFEKQGEQKPTDKDKPKFKVGDWVVSSYGKVNQVIAVDLDGDGFTLDDYTYFSGSWKDNYHLWTIQDAKGGDVLVSKFKQPFIYNGNYDEHNVGAYCGIVCDGSRFIETYNVCQWTDNKKIKPATKEQCDALMKAIDDAGFTFDFEKKELKKIKKNPAWSEEDDNMLNRLILHFDWTGNYRFTKSDCDAAQNWLISLKERVGCEVNCTTTKEWSEEDERMRQYVVNDLRFIKQLVNDRNYAVSVEMVEKEIDWLKSLRPQNTWKPSEDQMEALVRCVDYLEDSDNEDLLVMESLLEQLKELC